MYGFLLPIVLHRFSTGASSRKAAAVSLALAHGSQSFEAANLHLLGLIKFREPKLEYLISARGDRNSPIQLEFGTCDAF